MNIIQILQQTPLNKAYSYTKQDVGGIKCYVKGVSPGGSETPKREEAAYRFDQFLGLNLVPPTTCRIIGEKWFSIQQYREEHHRNKFNGAGDAHLFDCLVANEDRHGGNWLVDGTALVLIDHGMTFGDLKCSLVDYGGLYPARKTLTPKHRELCLKVRHSLRELHALLGDLLEPAAINAIVRRASRILRTNQYER